MNDIARPPRRPRAKIALLPPKDRPAALVALADQVEGQELPGVAHSLRLSALAQGEAVLDDDAPLLRALRTRIAERATPPRPSANPRPVPEDRDAWHARMKALVDRRRS